jgi:hypothetical protein
MKTEWRCECTKVRGFFIGVEVFIMKDELTPADYLYSVKIGSLLGFYAGWLIGIALLVYLDSPMLNNWPAVASIPLWNGFGWALYGFIVGGGGFFAHFGRKPVERPKSAALESAA